MQLWVSVRVRCSVCVLCQYFPSLSSIRCRCATLLLYSDIVMIPFDVHTCLIQYTFACFYFCFPILFTTAVWFVFTMFCCHWLGDGILFDTQWNTHRSDRCVCVCVLCLCVLCVWTSYFEAALSFVWACIYEHFFFHTHTVCNICLARCAKTERSNFQFLDWATSENQNTASTELNKPFRNIPKSTRKKN